MKEIFPESISDFIKWYIEKNQTFGYKAGLIILVIIIATIIDNFTGFSYYYHSKQKIEQFEQVAKIKLNKNIDSLQLKKLTQLQDELLTKADFRETIKDYFDSYTNNNLSLDGLNKNIMTSKNGFQINLFWHIITSSFFYIVILFLMPFLGFYGLINDSAARTISLIFSIFSLFLIILLNSYLSWLFIPVYFYSWTQYVFNIIVQWLTFRYIFKIDKNGKMPVTKVE